MSSPIGLSKPQEAGLRVVASQGTEGARYSSSTDKEAGYIGWQAADRLLELGLVEVTRRSEVYLTPDGRAWLDANPVCIAVRRAVVTELRLAIVPAPTVVGHGPNSPDRPANFVAAEIVAQVGSSGKVTGFYFVGTRLFGNGNARVAKRFHSDDPALRPVVLTARRVAATAQQRCETGAR